MCHIVKQKIKERFAIAMTSKITNISFASHRKEPSVPSKAILRVFLFCLELETRILGHGEFAVERAHFRHIFKFLTMTVLEIL